MKALTVRQPFADAIIHGHPRYGLKTAENRPKPIPPKYLGETILIHAGKAWHPLGKDVDWEQRPDARMAIIGTARLIGVHVDGGCCAPWGMVGYFHWQLADARPLTTPIPDVAGQLGLWTPDDDIQAAVHAQFLAGAAAKP
ncbi:hypothetical protein KN815_16260 [Streptomyces sp. 4503]|uniref:ASCH domain-containing protein n=1 Tax=Streptomyces niphimycinicus TaxID=2842201 RepID=A0ABS6CFI5_9ACTN|nr:hypothetical protein [Streptomyces niphimycinicus]MBU3865576.1 hypothetical protein [Streptomyces niphimycinicus]